MGEAGSHTTYADIGVGASLSICGVYVDFLLAGPDNQNDKHVNDQVLPDDEAFTINVGYQIPILPWLRVAPIVGYCQTNYGVIDMSTVNIHVNEGSSTGSIYHDYYVAERFHYFNYGGGLFIQPFKFLELYGVYTVRSAYGGIAINLSAFAKDRE